MVWCYPGLKIHACLRTLVRQMADVVRPWRTGQDISCPTKCPELVWTVEKKNNCPCMWSLKCPREALPPVCVQTDTQSDRWPALRLPAGRRNSSLTNCWCDTSELSPAHTSDTDTHQRQHTPRLFLWDLPQYREDFRSFSSLFLATSAKVRVTNKPPVSRAERICQLTDELNKLTVFKSSIKKYIWSLLHKCKCSGFFMSYTVWN